MAAPKGNLYALGNQGGRPRIYQSPEEMESRVIAYFDDCIERKINVTVTGLALYIGFNSRKMLYEYRLRQEFSDIIIRALTAVEHGYELNLHTFSAFGAKFALMNMGWKESQEQHITQTITTVTPQVINVSTPLASSEQTIKE